MLTSGGPPQNEFTDLIINEDEETVWEGTEPPHEPERKKKKEKEEYNRVARERIIIFIAVIFEHYR